MKGFCHVKVYGYQGFPLIYSIRQCVEKNGPLVALQFSLKKSMLVSVGEAVD